jgi:hypothetical protein
MVSSFQFPATSAAIQPAAAATSFGAEYRGRGGLGAELPGLGQEGVRSGLAGEPRALGDDPSTTTSKR